MVIDRNKEEQAKVIFNVNFKTLSRLIKSAFVGERTLYVIFIGCSSLFLLTE